MGGFISMSKLQNKRFKDQFKDLQKNFIMTILMNCSFYAIVMIIVVQSKNTSEYGNIDNFVLFTILMTIALWILSFIAYRQLKVMSINKAYRTMNTLTVCALATGITLIFYSFIGLLSIVSAVITLYQAQRLKSLL